jgi:hypothetical protein
MLLPIQKGRAGVTLDSSTEIGYMVLQYYLESSYISDGNVAHGMEYLPDYQCIL